MQRFRLRRAIGGTGLLLVLLCAVGASAARGQTPLSQIKTSDVTNDTFGDDLLKLWHRDIEHYRKLTKDPEELRDRGEKLILTVQEALLPYPRGPGFKAAVEMGQSLWHSGSRDPLVRAYFAIARSEELPGPRWGEWDRLTITWNNLKTLRTSQYPRECQTVPGMKFFEYAGPYLAMKDLQGVPAGPIICADTAKLMAARIGDASIGPEMQRCVYFELGTIRDSLPAVEALQKTCEQQRRGDPWTRLMLDGVRQWQRVRVAVRSKEAKWKTPEGNQRIRNYCRAASEAFSNAYERRPEFPEAATWMIIVSANGESTVGPRQWFERAVAAQFDYMPAYNGLAECMDPFLGGDPQALYAFGCECADTERYETAVPTVLFDALLRVESNHIDGSTWMLPNAYEHLEKMCTGIAEDPSRAGGQERGWTKRRAIATHACLAITTEHYEDARRLFDAEGADIDRKTMEVFYHRDPVLPILSAYAMSGKGSADIQEAFDLYNRDEGGRKQDALLEAVEARFQTAYAADEDPRSREFCQLWINLLAEYRAFQRGEWVAKKFGRTQIGWTVDRGLWSFDGAEASGFPAQGKWGPVLLQPDFLSSEPLEIDFELSFENSGKSKNERLGLRVVDQRGEHAGIVFVGVALDTRMCEARINNDVLQVPVELKDVNRFYIQLADGHVVVYVNGKLAIERDNLDFQPRFDELKLGCYSYTTTSNTVHIRNFRYREWDGKRSADKAAVESNQPFNAPNSTAKNPDETDAAGAEAPAAPSNNGG